MSQGRCVFVVGMARSGTSAVTEALSTLGLSLPTASDLMPGDQWNAHGYFESSSLTEFNGELLTALGGSLTAPPALPVGWERGDIAGGWADEAARLFEATFTSAAVSVWKDPRLCILLPFWRRVLSDWDQAAVFAWREPYSVARSLQENFSGMMRTYFVDEVPDMAMAGSLRAHGTSMTLDHGLALWEHFNRSALQNMSGLSVFATNYETVLADPNGFESDVRRWLRQQFSDQQFLEPSASVSHSSSTISPALRSQGDVPGSVRLPPSVSATFETLGGCLGAFPVFQPPPVAADQAWTVGVLDQKRKAEDLPMVASSEKETGAGHRSLASRLVSRWGSRR
jgi:hypothetical protein